MKTRELFYISAGKGGLTGVCLYLVCLFSALEFVSGQEGNGAPLSSAVAEDPGLASSAVAEADAALVEKPDDADTVYYIKDIIFDRTGKAVRTGLSWPYFLLRQGDMKIGERITGRDNLEAYRLDKMQLLINHRVLDRASIDLIFEEPEADGSVPVILHVTTVDTATIIALPQPRYDSNSGFRLVLKARDYNFLGTMNPLRVDLGYEWDSKKRESSFFALIDSDTPFRLFGYTWNFDFDHYFSYDPEAPFHYKNTTALSMELPVGFTTVTFGLAEALIVNEDSMAEYPDEFDESSKEFINPWVQEQEDNSRYKEFYMSTVLSASWKIPTKVHVGKFGELTYTPKIQEQWNYTPGGTIGYLRKGPAATLSHSLGFGRIDWIDNFRDGVAASISNSNTYNDYRKDWSSSLDVSVTGHVRIAQFFGVSGKLQYRDWFQDTYSKAGDSLRGIRDDDFSARRILSLNMDFPFRIFTFTPSIWFNKPGLRFLNLEFHLGPTVDAALVVEPGKSGISADSIRAAAGIEFIAFSYFWRNLYLRLSGGLNLRQLIDSGSAPDPSVWEIFLGMEHHF
ncbi:MAG: hypothetical protein LBH70_04090 [Spirochaetaceae bacterium]|nr:hypothetical protein [Spirochaetaceae bacterium]